jgi:hypothetical protein
MYVQQKFFQASMMMLCTIANLLKKKPPQNTQQTFDTLPLSASSNAHDAKISFSHPLDIIVNFSILL